MATYLSLFRGINVGGNHIVRMSDLKDLHEALGFTSVITYIQSGNVVFRSDNADVAQLARQIGESFAQKCGFRVDVVVRTAAELAEIVEYNPWSGQSEKEPKRLVVHFLVTPPESAALNNLQQRYTGPEELFLRGQDLYVYYPMGMGQSKLSSSILEKSLKTSGTARNWLTVLYLQELMQNP